MKKILAAGAAILLATTTSNAQDQDELHFHGGYVGAEAGYLDAGDGFNGLYYGATAGFRKQKSSGFVFGVEGNLGKANVDVGNFNNIIDNQWSVLGTAGWVFGSQKRDLFSIGLGYASVEVSALGQSATGDGVASFIGYERAIGKNLSFRLRATSYDALDTFIGTGGLSFRF